MHALRSPLVPHRMAPLAATLLLAGLSATALAQSAGTAPEPEALLPAAQGRGLLTVDLPNVDVEAASAAVGTMINRQILVDPRVKGTLSLRSERRIPLQDIWRQYLAALRGLGATVVENAGLLKVVPEAEAKLQTGTVQIGRRRCAATRWSRRSSGSTTRTRTTWWRCCGRSSAPTTPSTPTSATARWSSPTTPTTCSAWPASSRRWTRPRRPMSR